jgi:hypothetical protein
MSPKIQIRRGPRPAPRPPQLPSFNKTHGVIFHTPSETRLLRQGPDRPDEMIQQDEQA